MAMLWLNIWLFIKTIAVSDWPDWPHTFMYLCFKYSKVKVNTVRTVICCFLLRLFFIIHIFQKSYILKPFSTIKYYCDVACSSAVLGAGNKKYFSNWQFLFRFSSRTIIWNYNVFQNKLEKLSWEMLFLNWQANVTFDSRYTYTQL